LAKNWDEPKPMAMIIINLMALPIGKKRLSTNEWMGMYHDHRFRV